VKRSSTVTWNVYTDGASRGNPGHSGAGVYVVAHDDPLIERGIYLGKKTNNQAEYLALALALFFIKNKVARGHEQLPYLHIHADSELLVKQMRGIYKVKNPVLAKIKRLIETLLEPFSCRFTHIRRELNTLADALANEGVDEKKPLPITFKKMLEKALH